MKINAKTVVQQLDSPKRLGAWTFVETLIVIGIVLVLTSSVGLMAFRYLDQSKTASARSQIETYALAINAYFLDCKKLPEAANGLQALFEDPGVKGWMGPYISKPVQVDPWGNDYEYSVPGPSNLPYEIVSRGADGSPGGEGNDADISSAE